MIIAISYERNYRVASLATRYQTAKGINAESLNSIGKFVMHKLTKKAISYVMTEGPNYGKASL